MFGGRRHRTRRCAGDGGPVNLDSSDDDPEADDEIYASLRRRLEELEKSAPVVPSAEEVEALASGGIFRPLRAAGVPRVGVVARGHRHQHRKNSERWGRGLDERPAGATADEASDGGDGQVVYGERQEALTTMARTSETTPLNAGGGRRGSARVGSRWGSRYAHRYAAVPVAEAAAALERPGGMEAHSSSSSSSSRRRAVGAVGVLLAFGLAVSTLQQKQQMMTSKPLGSTYRGVLQQVGGVGGSGRSDEDGGSGDLTLVATNEYGEYDRGALALYGFDMLVEPHKATTISVVDPSWTAEAASSSTTSYSWLMVRQEDDDEDGSGSDKEWDGRDPVKRSLSSPTLTSTGEVVDLEEIEATDGAPSARSVTLTEGGTRYSLQVQQLSEGEDGSTTVVAEKTVTVVCKYLYCFHSGMHFLNAHASFDLWAERSLQMIDPSVAMHYWDFTIDATTLGPNWADSEIFTNDMYGSAMNSPDNDYQISEGWFKDVHSLYDPDSTFVADVVAPGHNLFGYIDARFNMQRLPGVARTASYCGLKGQIEFATCNVIINCFDDNDNISDWNECMEDQVHAANHGMIGGGFNCNTDMAEFQEENPEFGSGLLSFALEYVLANTWPGNSLVSAYNDCVVLCDAGDVGTSRDCSCSCTEDFDRWSNDEVYNQMRATLSTLATRAHGGKFVYQDSSATYEYGFMQDGEPLSEESNFLLQRTLLKIACEPGILGAMSVGPSILDPVFWALHPAFEKATQILQLSPTYKDTYDFTWVGKDCGTGVSGGDVDDTMPFTEQAFGFGDGTEFLTNQQIIDLLSPSNPSLPYVYDKFDTWGSCSDWDFEVEQK
eukprot:g6864.t2